MTLIVNSDREAVINAVKEGLERLAGLQLVVSSSDVNVRTEMLEGREHLVAPVVMLTEGVHDGSGGPMMYTKNEIRKAVKSWDHKPVVVYHPRKGGAFVSACEPEVLTRRKIGVVLNAKYGKKDGVGRLTAEAWIDPARCRAVDDRVLKATINENTMELSTGLFSERENSEGIHNGEEYKGVIRNMQPDHLAILPDEIGACSIADGAGYIRNENSDEGGISPRLSENFADTYFPILRAVGLDTSQLTFNEMSHDDLRSELIKQTHKKWDDMAWVEEVFDDFYVFSHKDKLYAQEYEIDKDDNITLMNMRQEVTREIRYKTTSGTILSNMEKELEMKKEEMVANIIKSPGNRFTANDEEKLNEMDEETLEKMQSDPDATASAEGSESDSSVADSSEGSPAPKTDITPEADDPAQPTPAAAAGAQPVVATASVKEFIESAPAEMQPALRAMHNKYDADKDTVIKSIMANKANKFSQTALKEKDLEELENIHSLMATSTPKNYNGQPVTNTGSRTPALSTPKMNLTE